MNQTIQKICIWSGPVFGVVMLGCLFSLGFIPPLPAAMDATQVANHYEEHRTLIRVGATVMMQGSVLMFLWVVAISVQLRRIEQGPPVLSMVQLVLGLCVNFLFVFIAVAWSVAAFRPEREATEIQAWNDFGWFMLVMPVGTLTLQALAIGVALLGDRSNTPLFPRWVGYFNIWAAILFLPGALVTFFKSGPFSWDGILVFWLAIVLFFVWIFVMAFAVNRAIDTPYPQETSTASSS
ncbi:MAG: hypothetical protein AAGF35_08545 [Pseudomonadota bacterium]